MIKLLSFLLLFFTLTVPVNAQEKRITIPLLQSGTGEYKIVIETNTVYFTGFFTFGDESTFNDVCYGTKTKISCTFTPAKLSQITVYYRSRNLPCHNDEIIVRISDNKAYKVINETHTKQCTYLPMVSNGTVQN